MKGCVNVDWNFKDDRPIYSQIAEIIKISLISEKITPGSKLPSVRELASEAGVNPNTMQKALTELERCGLVHSSRTSGRFATDDTELIQSEKRMLAEEKITEFLSRMGEMGFNADEIIRIINERKDVS